MTEGRQGSLPFNDRNREVTVKTLIRYAIACAVVSAFSIQPAFAAAEGSAKPTAQDRKSACTQEARGLKGAERDDFIAWCLTQDSIRPKQAKALVPGSQQDKMRKCNAVAKERALKGDERRAFMSSCLKA